MTRLPQILAVVSVEQALYYHVVHVYLHRPPDEGFEQFVYQLLVHGPRFFNRKGITL